MNMKVLKELKIVLILAAVILGMMLFRVYDKQGWKEKPGEATEKIIRQEIFLSAEELLQSDVPVMLIRLGHMGNDSLIAAYPAVEITPEKITEKEFLIDIRQPGKRLVLISASPGKAVESWIILNQLGVKNLYIYNDQFPGNEQFKYQFQPDTTFRLELTEDE